MSVWSPLTHFCYAHLMHGECDDMPFHLNDVCCSHAHSLSTDAFTVNSPVKLCLLLSFARSFGAHWRSRNACATASRVMCRADDECIHAISMFLALRYSMMWNACRIFLKQTRTVCVCVCVINTNSEMCEVCAAFLCFFEWRWRSDNFQCGGMSTCAYEISRINDIFSELFRNCARLYMQVLDHKRTRMITWCAHTAPSHALVSHIYVTRRRTRT